LRSALYGGGMTAFSTLLEAGFSGVSLNSTIVGNKSEQLFR
jgi:hypothetical protein